MRHVWRLDRDGYVVTSVWDVERRISRALPLHRLIARAPKGVLTDHVKGNKLDCRRCALRRATHAENTANRRSRRIGRSSRYRGVTLHKQTGRWQAACKHHNRCHYLGLFATQEEAALAYNREAKAIWGRFANLNRLPRLERQAA
jgi:AP2 domain.